MHRASFHALVPDGVFVAEEGKVRFEELGPPTQAEVERLLSKVRQRVPRLLERRGALPTQGPEDALQAYQAHSLRQRFSGPEVEVRPPTRGAQLRCFSPRTRACTTRTYAAVCPRSRPSDFVK
jgi:hypothetical protein